MSDAIVAVDGLGKRYRLSHHQPEPYLALRDVLASALAAPARWVQGKTRDAATVEDFWALKGVSFAVAPGEVVGIIGRNGAGKSTLLKILSRITEPTEGRVTLQGRVASLLEVGTGFHPELSGRENVFLNAAILGMTRAETARKFDEIVAFAEVERFLDTPVKRYSSGMYVRLAFAVAAHLEPEILIVDEVLAVGDVEFQKKSLGRMHDVSRSGRTVLFVSHNMAAVQALCSRAVWLEKGTVAFAGPVDETVSHYLAEAGSRSRNRAGSAVPLGQDLEISQFEVTPNPIESGGRAEFVLGLTAMAATRVTELALLIYSAGEARVAIIDLRGHLPPAVSAGETWTLRGWIESLPLVEGDYQVGVGVRSSGFVGDKLGLVEWRVAAAARPGAHAPYHPQYRGIVELKFGIHS